jgi:YVTN family beta-propeller protein
MPSQDDRLEGWKDIADYLRRGVRTVQRWEQKGLPVHRHDDVGSVYAFRSELDLWRNRTPEVLEPPIDPPRQDAPRRSTALIAKVGAAIAALGGIFWVSTALFSWRESQASIVSQASRTLISPDPPVIASIPVGDYPVRAVITANGAEVYVSNYGSNTVSVIDTTTNKVSRTLQVGLQPSGLAMTPDGSRVYVGQNDGKISVIDVRTKALDAVDAPGKVSDLAMTPAGRLYVAMACAGLGAIDVGTNTIRKLTPDGCAMGLAVTPDGRFLYVNYQNRGPGGGTGGHDAIGRFDASTGDFLGSITGLPNVGQNILVSPDGLQVWANGTDACCNPAYDHRGCPVAPGGLINVISSRSNRLIRSIGFAGTGTTFGHVVFPDSSMAAVGFEHELVLIDTKDFKAVGSIPLRVSPHMAFTPDGALAYVPVLEENRVAIMELVVPVRVSIKVKDSTATIFSTPAFDARLIDPKTVRLDGVPAWSNHNTGPAAWFENLGHGGAEHLSLHFDPAVLRFREHARVALEGKTYHGTRVKGSAEVTISR